MGETAGMPFLYPRHPLLLFVSVVDFVRGLRKLTADLSEQTGARVWIFSSSVSSAQSAVNI